MSLFGRAAAGLGEAAVDLGNKYLDAQIQNQRAQALMEMQRTNAKAIREDDDTFRNDPTRVARDRASKVADIEAEGSARSRTELAGRKAQAADPELLAAEVTRGKTLAEAAAESSRKATVAAGTDPEVLRATRALAAATHFEKPTGDKANKLDEAVKLQFQDYNKQQERLQEMLDKASLDPMTSKDKDGKDIPAVAEMRQRIQGFELRKQRLLADNDLIDVSKIADRVIKGETDPAVLKQAISQAKRIGGKYEDDFVPKVQSALDAIDVGKPLGPNAGPQRRSLHDAAREGASGPVQATASAARTAAENVRPVVQPVMDYLSGLGKDYDTPDGKSELSARVKEANSGGKPLSRTEALRAQQLGIK